MSTPWNVIREHLVAEGHMTNDGTTRRAQARTCPGCHAPVLVGLDADVRARPCTVDPTPLSALGEALALLGGRYTVEVGRAAGRYQLDERSRWRIRAKPAGDASSRFDVVAEHRCGSPPLPTAPTVHQSVPRFIVSEEPPF